MTVCAALALHVSETNHRSISGNLKECVRCQEWVKPVLGSTRRISSKNNLPGIYGIIKSISCCPQCGEKV